MIFSIKDNAINVKINEISNKAFFSGTEKNNKLKFIFQSSCDDSDDKVGKEKAEAAMRCRFLIGRAQISPRLRVAMGCTINPGGRHSGKSNRKRKRKRNGNSWVHRLCRSA